MILISACLAGRNVKYTGSNNAVSWLCEWIERHKEQVLLVCPEVMGGLPTPRLPAEIQFREADSGAGPENRRVFNKAGQDVTEQFLLGAEKVLELVKQHHITSRPVQGFTYMTARFPELKLQGRGLRQSCLWNTGSRCIRKQW